MEGNEPSTGVPPPIKIVNNPKALVVTGCVSSYTGLLALEINNILNYEKSTN